MARPKSKWESDNAEVIRTLYVSEKKSMQEIADKLGVNTQRVFRALKSLGIKTRSQSQAQKNALKTGRAAHPTLGKTMSEEGRLKLSESVATAWANLSPEEREQRAARAKTQYESMSDAEREKLQYKAALGLQKAGKEGSKLEKFLVDKLTENGYNVVFHKKGAIINANLEVDILLPALKIAIEVDGVFHSENVFGDLTKVQHRDNEKNGLLLSNGYVVIRLSNKSSCNSLHYRNSKLLQLLEEIKKIEKQFPSINNRLIYLPE